MENKIIEFIREFNSNLENSNGRVLLAHEDYGFQEGIVVPSLYLWDDQNCNIENFKTVSLSNLLKQISELEEVANNMLVEEIDKFFEEIKNKIDEKFTYARLKYERIAKLRWRLIISGTYNEDIMDDFIEVVAEDFKWKFDGLILDYELSN